MEIKIYIDGACVGNPGPGGWSAIVLLKNERKEIFGGEKIGKMVSGGTYIYQLKINQKIIKSHKMTLLK